MRSGSRHRRFLSAAGSAPRGVTSPRGHLPAGSPPRGVTSPLGHLPAGSPPHGVTSPRGHLPAGSPLHWVTSPLGHLPTGSPPRGVTSPLHSQDTQSNSQKGPASPSGPLIITTNTLGVGLRPEEKERSQCWQRTGRQVWKDPGRLCGTGSIKNKLRITGERHNLRSP